MTDAAPPQLTLDWLEIRKFRKVEPCRLEFGKGHNVILGINGTGKTQLLELIGAICSLRFDGLKDERADVDFAFGLGLSGASVALAVRRTVEVRAGSMWVESLVETIADEMSEVIALYQGWLDSEPSQVQLVSALSLPGRPPGPWGALAFRSRRRPRFDEGLEYFAYLTRESDDTRPVLTITENGPRSTGRDFAMGWLTMGLEPSDLGHPDAPLSEFCSIGDYTGELFLRVQSQTETAFGTEVRSMPPEFRFSRGKTIFTHERLSYGEKRYLAFSYYLAVAIGWSIGGATIGIPIVADELTNGLHRKWVDACFDRMEGRQTFLATQSPLLLDRVWVDSPEHAKNTFVICKRVGRPEETRLSWKQLDDAQAKAVFEGFERRVVHMSEILHFEGIW